MENATQFGIYKIVTFLLFNILGFNLIAQDYYVDLDGNKHEIEILLWNFDRIYCVENQQEKELFPDSLQSVYREIADVTYISIDSLLNNENHKSFLIPSIESIKALSIDNFRDENYEIWSSGDYTIFKVTNDVFIKSTEEMFLQYVEKFSYPTKKEDGEVQQNDVFIHSDKAGFNKIVSNDITDDEYKILLSKYLNRPSLKDSIFNDEVKLKPKKFIEFFDENESPLTAIAYDDKDKAEYMIRTLKYEGALIVLLNLTKKKIELYRNAGNEKLAKKLEEDLLKDNLSYAYAFSDSNVFNYCKIYLTDAGNINEIVNGKRADIFLDKDLNLDTNIVMNEEFFLFAREGVLFETQLADPIFNGKKRTVTSTPVVQDAMVIYGIDNVQLMQPFPNYVRKSTSRFAVNKKLKRSNEANEKDFYGIEDFDKILNQNLKESNLKEFNNNIFGIASSFNAMFHNYYMRTIKGEKEYRFIYNFNNKFFNDGGGKWYPNPFKSPSRFDFLHNPQNNFPNNPPNNFPNFSPNNYHNKFPSNYPNNFHNNSPNNF